MSIAAEVADISNSLKSAVAGARTPPGLITSVSGCAKAAPRTSVAHAHAREHTGSFRNGPGSPALVKPMVHCAPRPCAVDSSARQKQQRRPRRGARARSGREGVYPAYIPALSDSSTLEARWIAPYMEVSMAYTCSVDAPRLKNMQGIPPTIHPSPSAASANIPSDDTDDGRIQHGFSCASHSLA